MNHKCCKQFIEKRVILFLVGSESVNNIVEKTPGVEKNITFLSSIFHKIAKFSLRCSQSSLYFHLTRPLQNVFNRLLNQANQII